MTTEKEPIYYLVSKDWLDADRKAQKELCAKSWYKLEGMDRPELSPLNADSPPNPSPVKWPSEEEIRTMIFNSGVNHTIHWIKEQLLKS